MEETTIEYRVMHYSKNGLIAMYPFDNMGDATTRYNLTLPGLDRDQQYAIMKRVVIETCTTTVFDSRRKQIIKEK